MSSLRKGEFNKGKILAVGREYNCAVMTAADLHYRFYEAESASAPVVILHGLFGSSRNWHSIAQALCAGGRGVYAVDLRNHGASAHLPAMDYELMSADLEAFVADTVRQPAHLIGHSMGGKVAMVAALRGVAPVRSLSVVDIAPVGYPDHIAHNLGLIDAMAAIDPQQYATRTAIDAALAAAVPDSAVRQLLLQNIITANNHHRWRINLPALRQAIPTLTDFPVIPTVATIPTTTQSTTTAAAIPVQFLKGEHSDYITKHHHAAIKNHFPTAHIRTIPAASHLPHAQNPQATINHLKSHFSQQ